VGYEIINLGGGKEPTSLSAIIRYIEQYLGKRARIVYQPFPKTDMVSTYADIKKANRLLGWEPVVSISEGLEKTVNWHIENRAKLREIKLAD
jgi:UDP-glucuronate 4-epimerase